MRWKEGIFVVVILSLVWLVMAAPGAPTTLIFGDNATASYDEGSFSVNWTAGGDDAAANYTVYVAFNDTLYMNGTNTSATGYLFSNATEANYTFIVEAVNVTGSVVNSTANVSMFVDANPPSFLNISNWSDYTNTSVSVFLNASDLAGVDTYYVNDTTNFNVTAGQYLVNLTAMTAGVYWLNLSVNDSVGNVVYRDLNVTITAIPAVAAAAAATSTGGISSKSLVLGNQFQKIGYGKRYIFDVGEESHSFYLRGVNRTDNTVKVSIYSEVIALDLDVGVSKEVDLDSDGVSDIILKVDKIYDNSIAVDMIINEVSGGVGLDDSVDGDGASVSAGDDDISKDEKGSNAWIWWVVGIGVVLIVLTYKRKSLEELIGFSQGDNTSFVGNQQDFKNV